MKWMENGGDKQKANNIKSLHLLTWYCWRYILDVYRVCCSFCTFCSLFFFILCVFLLVLSEFRTQYWTLANVAATRKQEPKISHTKWNGCNTNNQFDCQKRTQHKSENTVHLHFACLCVCEYTRNFSSVYTILFSSLACAWIDLNSVFFFEWKSLNTERT